MKELSVCITTFNRKELLGRALASVAQQQNIELEIIIVDDCSSDGTQEMVEQTLRPKDARIRYLRHETNQGLAAARNTAIAHAEGDWFAFCDDDDQWPANFARNLLRSGQINPCSQVLLGMPCPTCEACLNLFSTAKPLRTLMLAGIAPPVASQFYQTAMLKKCGGYNSRIRSGVDHDLWVTLAESENPLVSVATGNTAIVGKEPGRQRMTTQEEKRRARIKESLEVWEPHIKAAFGDAFYQHFVSSYQIHLDTGFFIKDVQSKRYLSAFLRLNNPVTRGWLIRRLFGIKSSPSHCGAFPPFQY
jgi:glycosyltransferase involved in cell wall biosynthesis